MKTWHEAELEEINKLRKEVEELKTSPLSQQIRMEKEVETLARRRETKAKIDALDDQLKALPSAEEAVAEFKAELSILQDREQSLKQKINEKVFALRSEKLQIENEQGRLKTILLETSDPLIGEAITFFLDRREILLHKSIDRQTRAGERNIFTMMKKMITFSNAPSITSALKYCLDCLHTLEGMRLEPLLDIEKIETLKRGIPDVGQLTEIIGEKPFERINTDPRTLLKSDSQLDWEMGKLNEKFKKVMGR
jgi:hypothetical protein